MRYMKELRAAILALEKRIGDIEDERRALWQRLEGAFNDRMLASAQRRGGWATLRGAYALTALRVA